MPKYSKDIQPFTYRPPVDAFSPFDIMRSLIRGLPFEPSEQSAAQIRGGNILIEHNFSDQGRKIWWSSCDLGDLQSPHLQRFLDAAFGVMGVHAVLRQRPDVEHAVSLREFDIRLNNAHSSNSYFLELSAKDTMDRPPVNILTQEVSALRNLLLHEGWIEAEGHPGIVLSQLEEVSGFPAVHVPGLNPDRPIEHLFCLLVNALAGKDQGYIKDLEDEHARLAVQKRVLDDIRVEEIGYWSAQIN